MIMKVLGKNIRRCRLGLGLTLEALSEKCNLHSTYLGHIERGTKLPSLQALGQIATALHLQAGSLLFPDLRQGSTP